MVKKIELTLELGDAKVQKTVNLPSDWDEMSEDDRTEYVQGEADDYKDSAVKAYGKVVG